MGSRFAGSSTAPPTGGRHDRFIPGEQLGQETGLVAPKVRLAGLGEHGADRSAEARFELDVEVDEAAPEPAGHERAHRGLARAHHPHEHQVATGRAPDYGSPPLRREAKPTAAAPRRWCPWLAAWAG